MLVIAEFDIGTLDFPLQLDINRFRAIDHDIGDAVHLEKLLERAETEHIVRRFLGDL